MTVEVLAYAKLQIILRYNGHSEIPGHLISFCKVSYGIHKH